MYRPVAGAGPGSVSVREGFFGFRYYVDLAFPLWDRHCRLAIYFGGDPIISTSAWAAAEGLTHRPTNRLPTVGTPREELSWFYSGDWAAAYAGDLHDVAPGIPITDFLRSGAQTRPQKIRSGWLGATVARATDSMRVCINESSPTFVHPGLCRALGYSVRDWSWVPESWRTMAEPDHIESGYDVVMTGDDAPIPATLRWHRMRLPPAWNAMSVTLLPSWTGELTSTSSPIHPSASLAVPTPSEERWAHFLRTAVKASPYSSGKRRFRTRTDQPWTNRGRDDGANS